MNNPTFTILIIGKEYWMGLENIYQMTNARSYSLRVMIQDFDGTTRTATYKSFKLTENVSTKCNRKINLNFNLNAVQASFPWCQSRHYSNLLSPRVANRNRENCRNHALKSNVKLFNTALLNFSASL